MRNRILYIISFLLFITDYISKMVIVNCFKYNTNIVIIKNFFYINCVRNDGGAFSIFSGNVIFIIIVSFIVLLFLCKYINDKELDIYKSWGYGLIIGGALGNLFDRIIYGYVIDFFDFYIFGYDFPVFNVADCGIVIGVLILIFCEVRDKNGNNGRRKIENR